MCLPLRVLALALAFGACSSDDPTRGVDRLRIGTWNLEHFGSRKPARSSADFARIAALIASLEIDVLAIQEVNGPVPLQRLVRHLDSEYDFALGSTGGIDKGRISVGFLWNRRRARLLQCEEMRDLPAEAGGLPIFHRNPVNAVFQSLDGTTPGLDLRAIAVHLKAGSDPDDRAKRRAEAESLRTYVADLRADENEDRDIVVLGDFNHTYDAPAHRTLRDGGMVHYLEAGADPTLIHYDAPIDHIAVTPELNESVIAGTFQVHNDQVPYGTPSAELLVSSKNRWRRAYSDHFPVTLDLTAEVDRDPSASFRAPKHSLKPGRHDD